MWDNGPSIQGGLHEISVCTESRGSLDGACSAMAGEWPRQDPVLPRKWFGFEHISILDNKVPTIFWHRIRLNFRSCGAVVYVRLEIPVYWPHSFQSSRYGYSGRLRRGNAGQALLPDQVRLKVSRLAELLPKGLCKLLGWGYFFPKIIRNKLCHHV